MDDLIQQGIDAYKSGDRVKARNLLIAAVKQFPDDERSWGWLYNVCNSDNERIQCLKQILRINPNNEKARQLLNTITGVKPAKQQFVKSSVPEQSLKSQVQNNNVSSNDIDATQPVSKIGLKLCSFCGKEIPVNATVCKYCGKAVFEPTENVNINQPPQKSPVIGQSVPTTSGMSKNTKTILWAIGICVFLLVLIGLFSKNSNSTVTPTQTNYQIEYEVVGTGGGILETYVDPNGVSHYDQIVHTLPWRIGWSNVPYGNYYFFLATNVSPGSSIFCNLYLNGALVRTSSSTDTNVPVCSLSGYILFN